MAQNLEQNKIRRKKRRRKKSSAVTSQSNAEIPSVNVQTDLRAIDSDVFQTQKSTKSDNNIDNLPKIEMSQNKIENSSKIEKMPETPVLPRKSASPVMKKSAENNKNGLKINQKRRILPLISQKTTDSTPYRIELKSSTSIESYETVKNLHSLKIQGIFG